MQTKRFIRTFGLVALAAVSFSTVAAAQSGCLDAYGRPVTVIFASINDGGYSTQVMGQPVIYLNPVVWQTSSPAMRTFIFGHECGHHALATTNETQADCYGAQVVVNAGFDIREILAWMARNPNWDWTHAPGPARAAAIGRCVGTTLSGFPGGSY